MKTSWAETWGHCKACVRWFFIPSDTISALVSSRCPGCAGPPDEMEERQGDLRISLTVAC